MEEVCKICMKPIKDHSFYSLFIKDNKICEECFRKFSPKFIEFNIGIVKGLSIYEYDQEIKELLFKFKGCFDYELKDVFLDRYLPYLKVRYHGYVIVPLPSYELDDEIRGFNHVESIYNRLNLPIYKIIRKTKRVKQSDQRQKERMKIGKHFMVNDLTKIAGKKVLIVDDICTTGSSIQAAIDLLRKGKPRKIAVLVVAKNRFTG